MVASSNNTRRTWIRKKLELSDDELSCEELDAVSDGACDGQDIIDAKHYGQIATPVLALAGERNYPYLRELLPTQASDVRVVKINSSSHYVPEDQPEAVVRELLGLFKS